MTTPAKFEIVAYRTVRHLLMYAWLLPAPAISEPVKFDWRFHPQKDEMLAEEQEPQAEWDAEPNPIVLPVPDSASEEEEKTAGWHWLTPRIAKSPGSGSDRTAIQLANQAQEEAMARQHSPLNDVLPGALNGLAPMAIESGVELRF